MEGMWFVPIVAPITVGLDVSLGSDLSLHQRFPGSSSDDLTAGICRACWSTYMYFYKKKHGVPYMQDLTP